MNWRQLADRAADWLAPRLNLRPSAAVILGSGLGGLAARIERRAVWPFAEIPGFSRAVTAAGHRGELIAGWLEETPVLAMAGRYHRYGGHSNDQCMHPVRVMAALGIERLIVSNAAGGLNPHYCVGDVVVIRDHINLLGGISSPAAGARSALPCQPPGHGNVYDAQLAAAAVRAATVSGFAAHQGTYLATLGPNYETRAEYRMMRRFGADVAGMSTVPEVMAASEAQVRVLAVSMVTNLARPDCPQVADHQEVLEAGRAAAAKMECVVRAGLRCP